MRAIQKIFFLVAGGIIFLLVFSFVGFINAIRPARIKSAATPENLGLIYETVSFPTRDNLTLRGWFIPRQNAGQTSPQNAGQTPTIMLLHGYPADKGDVLPAVAFLSETYNLFLFDFRYFGESEGAYSTAGAKETEDVRAAIRYLETRGIRRVGIWGFSMGGAVALMTANNTPEVAAVIADSSYASLRLMASELYPFPVLKYPLGLLTELWAKLFLGVTVRDASPADAARTLRIPVLIIHSREDRTIPFPHAALLQAALADNPTAESWFREDALHGALSRDYEERIYEFFRKNL